jgi:DNA polymerase family A
VKFIVFDSESDGLWKEATKLHVLSYTSDGTNICSTANKEEITQLFKTPDTYFVAHNSIRHDLPLMNKLFNLGLDYKRIIDTLPLSWYLNEGRPKHGLESFGVDYGVPKPKIDDWEGLTYEEYAHRCSEDVKINWFLWQDLWSLLISLYKDEKEALRLCLYMSFKMDCAREQEEVGIRLDLDLAQKSYDTLLEQQQHKTVELAKAMPKKVNYKAINKPKDIYKKDGTLSVAGRKWLDLLAELKMPHNTVGPVRVIESTEDGNPGSTDQVKEWLHSLGWKPRTFKYVKDKATGKERMIEQVRDEGELCESVTDLISKDPAVEILEGLTVINHRLSIFRNFLSSHKDGWLEAGIEGITNTFRFKHKNPIVNLPGVDKPWGKEIRSCLLPPEGHVWAGSDMVSLEDTTKRHYMKPLDPKYVEEMAKPGYDPHLNLALFAGAVTQEQIDQHNAGTINLKPIRKKFKAANYSCIYGVGKAKLAREIDATPKEAGDLIDAYWKRNWAIKKVMGSQKVKIVGGKMWLQNPVSGFWHSLRAEKDIFSTLNQSTGVYAFDTWVGFSRALGMKVAATFHDEQLCPVEIGQERMATSILKDAIGYTNNKLKLNVKLDIDVQIGSSYGEVH